MLCQDIVNLTKLYCRSEHCEIEHRPGREEFQTVRWSVNGIMNLMNFDPSMIDHDARMMLLMEIILYYLNKPECPPTIDGVCEELLNIFGEGATPIISALRKSSHCCTLHVKTGVCIRFENGQVHFYYEVTWAVDRSLCLCRMQIPRFVYPYLKNVLVSIHNVTPTLASR